MRLVGHGREKIWLDDIQCQGTESSLADCYHNGWDAHDCTHLEDVVITCEVNPLPGAKIKDTSVA